MVLLCFPASLWHVFAFVSLLQRNQQYDLFVNYKELVHTVMEAGKSQDPQNESGSWTPRRTNGFVSICVLRPENQQNWWCSTSSQASRLETEEEPTVQFEFRGRNEAYDSLQRPSGRRSPPFLWEGQPFESIQSINGLGEAHPH